jgi:type II secretory pathway component GspD/PulD (secretin)
MAETIAFFARYSGRSIVAGTGVTGTVTAAIVAQPWDVALDALLAANGLTARELESGIILVEGAGATAPIPGRLVSRIFRLAYQPAAEIEPVVRSMLSPRGTVAAVGSVNALVVTDEERVLRQVAAILGQI